MGWFTPTARADHFFQFVAFSKYQEVIRDALALK
jgi:hypothetical protein